MAFRIYQCYVPAGNSQEVNVSPVEIHFQLQSSPRFLPLQRLDAGDSDVSALAPGVCAA
ncbi:hypothetical protein PoB_007636700 [Plakobranchus ocellatus]|uniref:Uncharacterized protein n=1 Tax=Plakobranchus ocellatus TaxID=259542 RepID=A0AAV4DZR5_9GAST|nr:hypothetical protein PoB_007636700 [Plakobranchus ocellatus]